jgi:flagellar hook-associated protein 1 FlgK
MTLSSALSAANSGLATAARRADITAGNIANASTPGYVRRSLQVGELVLNGQGQGARVIGVDRAQDSGLTRERRQAGASAARSDIIARSYTDLNRELGAPGDGYGLFASYQNVESALRELSVTPESPALQNAGVNALSSLALQFNEQYAVGQGQRLNADNAIARSVRSANSSLHRIAELNGQIAGLSGNASEIAALEDERGRVLDEISQIIPIKIIPKDHGQIDITTDQGVFLLAGHVFELEFTQAGVIPPGSRFGDGSNILSGLSVGDQSLTPNTDGNFAISSGSLAGLFTVRDVITPGFLDGLDSLAGDLVNRFANTNVDPTTLAGMPGLFTDNGLALDPNNMAGLASRLRINAAIDTSQGGFATRLRDGLGGSGTGPVGNADILNNLLDAFTNSNPTPTGSGLAGTLSSSELAAGFSSIIGEKRVNADAVATTSLARASTLADAELSLTGVDTDAEIQSLLLIEQAYAANARVIQTISDMLDTLLQL